MEKIGDTLDIGLLYGMCNIVVYRYITLLGDHSISGRKLVRADDFETSEITRREATFRTGQSI
jgi:hypothetical protein